MSKYFKQVLAGAALVVCSSVEAATLCSAPGVQPDGLDVSDVTFRGVNSTDCNGVFTGTATEANLGFDGFTAIATALPGASATGSLGGEDFTLAVSSFDNDLLGDWSLAWSGLPEPFTMDLVAVVQSAAGFASYFFDDLVLTAAPGAGTWVVTFPLSENGSSLASFAVFGRDLRTPTPPPPPNQIDEPATLLLVTGAAVGLWAIRRRRALQMFASLRA